MQSLLRGFALIMLLVMCAPVFAHRAPGSLTTIKWNDVSGTTEIVHRLHSHDAELGVGAHLEIAGLSVEGIEGRAQIALYVEAHFGIRSQSGEAVQLELVGAELSGDYLLVYQEAAGRLTGNILIRDDILRDAFPAQLNQVNIEDGETVHSLVFTKASGWLSYTFVH